MQETRLKAEHTYHKSRKMQLKENVQCKFGEKMCIAHCAGECSNLEFIQVWDLSLMPQHRFSDLEAEGFSQRRRHCVPYLAMLVPDGAGESEVIPENT